MKPSSNNTVTHIEKGTSFWGIQYSLKTKDDKIVATAYGPNTADHFAALWNLSERLNLTTDEINEGVIDDMLVALEDIAKWFKELSPVCPICHRFVGILDNSHGDGCVFDNALRVIQKVKNK